MLTEEQKLSANQRRSGRITAVNVSQSDIRAAARFELKKLHKLVKAKSKSTKAVNKAHLEDIHSITNTLTDRLRKLRSGLSILLREIKLM